MSVKLFTVVAFLAAATTALGQTCDAGTLQCCQNVGNAASDPTLAQVAASILGVTAQLDLTVGTGCSSSNGNWLVSESYSSIVFRRLTGDRSGASLQKVCCENTEFGENAGLAIRKLCFGEYLLSLSQFRCLPSVAALRE